MLQNALVVPHAYNWNFTVRPNDMREDRLSRYIVTFLLKKREISAKLYYEISSWQGHNRECTLPGGAAPQV